MLVASPWPGSTWVSSGSMPRWRRLLMMRNMLPPGKSVLPIEEGVAREGYVLCLAIEGDGSVAVAWGFDDLEFVVAEFDDFIFLEEVADRREAGVQLHLVEGFCLVLESLHQFLVAL